jgi:hypothetical protein
MTRVFNDFDSIYRGDDLALVKESGFQVMSRVELENEGMVREVSYPEALRYIGFPDINKIV